MFLNFHRTEGEKEWGYTLSSHLYGGVGEWGYTLLKGTCSLTVVIVQFSSTVIAIV